ncbi:hypothetical protein EKM02_02045 [Flavobacterium sp. RSP49]|uniref:hypothetical protein n=1 Tax=Flavobacterium sp. RSP49 TaxID=2497487 RepID=UPI000F83FB18|nr:hypothetical protein [Flavobacterium sp. RSP49]RTZ02852.1 hypothetical protein EKM02_02045 [Flavobacterium sp. RSP49]
MLNQISFGQTHHEKLLNKIIGRTKRLKKLVVLEKKENDIKLISELYIPEYFTVQLVLASDYVNDFKYFIVDNEFFLEVLASKNKQKTTFFMVALAEEYKAILAKENRQQSLKK